MAEYTQNRVNIYFTPFIAIHSCFEAMTISEKKMNTVSVDVLGAHVCVSSARFLSFGK
jgi:hypothetical protein